MKKFSNKKMLIVLVLLIVIFIAVTLSARKNNSSNSNEQGNDTMLAEDEKYYYDAYGNKYFKGDTELTYEDVLYAYIKSLALLDFSTAYNYVSNGSSVVYGFENINSNGNSSNIVNDTLLSYKSKMYKKVISSLIVDKIVDTVIMPDKYIVTVKISHLDLNNDTFWSESSEEIYKKLFELNNSVDTKSIQFKTISYLTSFIQDKYAESNAPKKTSEIVLTIEKNDYGSWLISDDTDLYLLCTRNDGTYPMNSIEDGYNNWYKMQIQNKYNSDGLKNEE